MKRTSQLPDNYGLIAQVDLQKNKKQALIVNAAAAVIMVLMFIPAALFVPVSLMFDSPVRLIAMMVSVLAYLILHEAAHAVAMELLGTKKVRFGFTGLYAYAGSSDYYGKGAYSFIAMAPVVFWGIVLLILNFLVPYEWFWVVYFIQICNISGAAGDFYVTLRFVKMPKDILVRDTGVEMHVFSASIDSIKDQEETE